MLCSSRGFCSLLNVLFIYLLIYLLVATDPRISVSSITLRSCQFLHAVASATCVSACRGRPTLSTLLRACSNIHSPSTPPRKECAWLAEQSGKGVLKARCRGGRRMGGVVINGKRVTRDFQTVLCQGYVTLRCWQGLSLSSYAPLPFLPSFSSPSILSLSTGSWTIMTSQAQ